MPQTALLAVSAHLAEWPPDVDRLIFTDEEGQPIRRPHAGHIWRKAARVAGIEGHSFHSLRHYCASALIAAGCSVKVVQRHLGHASAKVTLDVYSHLWPDDEDRIRAALERALEVVCHDGVTGAVEETKPAGRGQSRDQRASSAA